jgi:hypothetical protein
VYFFLFSIFFIQLQVCVALAWTKRRRKKQKQERMSSYVPTGTKTSTWVSLSEATPIAATRRTS